MTAKVMLFAQWHCQVISYVLLGAVSLLCIRIVKQGAWRLSPIVFAFVFARRYEGEQLLQLRDWLRRGNIGREAPLLRLVESIWVPNKLTTGEHSWHVVGKECDVVDAVTLCML